MLYFNAAGRMFYIWLDNNWQYDPRWSKDELLIGGQLSQGKSCGIENEVFHTNPKGVVNIYPEQLTSSGKYWFDNTVYRSDKMRRLMRGSSRVVDVMELANGTYYYSLKSGNTVLEKRLTMQNVSKAVMFNESNKWDVSIDPFSWKDETLQLDGTWKQTASGSLKQTLVYLNATGVVINYKFEVQRKVVEQIKSAISRQVYNFGYTKPNSSLSDALWNGSYENARWSCYTQIAAQVTKVNSNLAMYTRDTIKSDELLTPFTEFVNPSKSSLATVSSKVLPNKIVSNLASCYLSYYYGIRLSVRDTNELMAESVNIKLLENDDTPLYRNNEIKDNVKDSVKLSKATKNLVTTKSKMTLDDYQDALMKGYTGSIEEYRCEYDAYIHQLPKARNYSATEFLLNNLISNLSHHARTSVKSYHASSSFYHEGLKATVYLHTKMYIEPYSQESLTQAVKGALRQWDADITAENIVDFIPYSFCLNWLLTTDTTLTNEETEHTLRTLRIALTLSSYSYTKHVHDEYGQYSIKRYVRFFENTREIRPMGWELKPFSNVIKHWKEGGALLAQKF